MNSEFNTSIFTYTICLYVKCKMTKACIGNPEDVYKITI